MMRITTRVTNGKWKEYTLSNDSGISMNVLNYGGTITKIMVPDQKGNIENVVLGYRDYRDYESNPHYFGAIIGRVAGRIQGASFKVENRTYPLAANNGKNHLHGGPNGFHQVIWDTIPFQTQDAIGLKLTYKSVNGEAGYPGNLEMMITYTLNNKNQLSLDYAATCDQTTPLSLTNHSYFNLSGNLKNTIQDHHVTIASSRFAELNEDLIPTGKLVDVDETPFDFRNNGLVLGTGFNSTFMQNRIVGNGYDHYFIFDNKLAEAVGTLEDPISGRVMSVKTDQPGMVMYTSNAMDTKWTLREGPSRKYLGICFETQASPASLHHQGFPSAMVKSGEKYEKQTVFSFKLKH